MLKKLIRKLTNNFGLKILAALSAIILWVIVGSIDDPVGVQRFTASVSLTNENYITEQNKCYEVLDGDNTVTFSVSAKRSIRRYLSNSDFRAVADMERIEYDEKSGNWRVPVTITAQRYSTEVRIVSKQLYKEIELVDLGRTQKPIMADTKGVVADNCALGDVSIVGANLMNISGPASIVSRIDTVTATINVDGMSADVTDSVVPTLFDAEGNVIDTTKLTLNITTVTIKAQILGTKDVALEFQTTGEPADGYLMTGLSYRPEMVRIKGETATLNPVNKITIPAEVLDLTGATSTIETIVDITSYLPRGASLVLASDAKISVTVRVEPVVRKTMQVPVGNLVIEHVRDGFHAEFMEDTFAVEIKGAKSVMDTLEAKDVTGSADASGLGSGEHYLAITLTMNRDDCELAIPARVLARITEEGAEGELNGGDGGASGESDSEGIIGDGNTGPGNDEDPDSGGNSGEDESTGDESGGESSSGSGNTSGGNDGSREQGAA